MSESDIYSTEIIIKNAPSFAREGGHMIKKYINYYDGRVYAIFYRKSNTIYYNLFYTGTTKLIIYK